MYVIAPGKDGMLPLNWFLDMVKLAKKFILEIDEGIEPVIPFPLNASLVKLIKFPMEFKVPTTLLLHKSKATIAKLLSHVTPNQLLTHGSPISQF